MYVVILLGTISYLPFLDLDEVPHFNFSGYDDHAYRLALPDSVPFGENVTTSNTAWVKI